MKKIAEDFKIYIGRLSEGKDELFEGSCSPEFLEVQETDLRFDGAVSYKGKAYLADDELVIRFNADATCVMPCTICNDLTQVQVQLVDAYHIVPLKDVKGAVFDLGEALREAILLETPQFAECNGGKCPSRDEVSKYLVTGAAREYVDVTQPFADLELNDEQLTDNTK